jgi:hypothetical protein
LDKVKVGLTTRNDIDKRVKELSSSTSIPTPFEIHSYIKCDNVRFYEKIIHRELVEKGIKKDKEFFTCKPEEVEKVFMEFCKKKVYKTEKKNEEVNESKDDIIATDTEEEWDEEIPEPELKTLEEFYKNSRITEIVITNKKKKCGYLRFGKNKPWRIIDNDDNIDGETLKGWIEHNCPYKFGGELINDIIKKCYNKNFMLDDLKYNQILVSTGNSNYVIVDFLNKNILELNINLSYQKYGRMYVCDIPTKEEINEFNKIVRSYLSEDRIKKFKRICKSLYVQNEKIIYEDLRNDTNLKKEEYSLYNYLTWSFWQFYGDQYIVNYNHLGEKEKEEVFDSNTRLIVIRGFRDQKIIKKYEGKTNIIYFSKDSIEELGYNLKGLEEHLCKKIVWRDIEDLFECTSTKALLKTAFWATDFYEI